MLTLSLIGSPPGGLGDIDDVDVEPDFEEVKPVPVELEPVLSWFCTDSCSLSNLTKDQE